ncbi:hypothetical protein EGP91_01685 [bacterium]|nr:hypothetical protein [bacterium]
MKNIEILNVEVYEKNDQQNKGVNQSSIFESSEQRAVDELQYKYLNEMNQKLTLFKKNNLCVTNNEKREKV